MLSYFSLRTKRATSVVILMVLCRIVSDISDLFLSHWGSLFLLIESVAFFIMFGLVAMRHEPKTQPYDRDNILLAFYRGEKGSVIMNIFELLGMPVKSLCIVAGGKCLILKSDKEGFQFKSSEVVLKNKEKYLIVDTGKKATSEFICNMSGYHNKKASKWGLRICCIEGVSPLLQAIGQKFKPDHLGHNSPSWYLSKVV